MMDRARYDYIPVRACRPNVVYQHSKSNGGDAPNVRVASTLEIVLNKLSLRHPDWTFVLQRGLNTNGVRVASYCAIYKDNEYLGYFCNHYDDEISIDCPKLSKTRQRGSATHTRNQAKAIKVIEDNFAPKTIREEVHETSELVHARLSHRLSELVYSVDRIQNRIMPAMISYLKENWDTLLPYLQAELQQSPSAEHRVENLLSETDKRDKVRRMMLSGSHGGAYYILIKDGKYVVAPAQSTKHFHDYKTYTDDDLPNKLKVNLGMLKLVDVETVLTGVGVKISKDAYFVMEPDE